MCDSRVALRTVAIIFQNPFSTTAKTSQKTSDGHARFINLKDQCWLQRTIRKDIIYQTFFCICKYVLFVFIVFYCVFLCFWYFKKALGVVVAQNSLISHSALDLGGERSPGPGLPTKQGPSPCSCV